MPAFPLDLDLLLFDLDGTTADTRRDLTEAVNHVRRVLGWDDLDTETVVSYVGDGVAPLLERALPDASDGEMERARALFDAYYAEHFCDHTTAYPGIESLLAHFAHKQKAVISNKAETFTRPLVERMGLSDRFDLVVGARAGMRKKPAPDVVLYALEQLGVAPRRALLIGDSPQDIEAGQAAGVYTCAVTYGFRPAEALRPLRPDVLIDHPLELRAYVR